MFNYNKNFLYLFTLCHETYTLYNNNLQSIYLLILYNFFITSYRTDIISFSFLINNIILFELIIEMYYY